MAILAPFGGGGGENNHLKKSPKMKKMLFFLSLVSAVLDSQAQDPLAPREVFPNVPAKTNHWLSFSASEFSPAELRFLLDSLPFATKLTNRKSNVFDSIIRFSGNGKSRSVQRTNF